MVHDNGVNRVLYTHHVYSHCGQACSPRRCWLPRLAQRKDNHLLNLDHAPRLRGRPMDFDVRRLIAAFLSPRASRAPDSRGPSIAARESLEPSRIGAPGSGGRRRVLQPSPSVSLGAWKDTTRARFKRQQGVWQPLMMVTAASFGAGNAPFQRPQAATVGPAKTGGDSPRP